MTKRGGIKKRNFILGHLQLLCTLNLVFQFPQFNSLQKLLKLRSYPYVYMMKIALPFFLYICRAEERKHELNLLLLLIKFVITI